MEIKQAAVVFLDPSDSEFNEDFRSKLVVSILMESLDWTPEPHRTFLVQTLMYYMTYTECVEKVEEGVFTQEELDMFWEGVNNEDDK